MPFKTGQCVFFAAVLFFFNSSVYSKFCPTSRSRQKERYLRNVHKYQINKSSSFKHSGNDRFCSTKKKDLDEDKSWKNYLPRYNLCRKDEREIIFGQTLPLFGANSLYSRQIISGIKAKFMDINSSGGIKGKYLRLETLDDHCDFDTSVGNVKKMHFEDGIDIFLGNVGTENVLGTLPLIKDQEILMLFPFAFDDRLRDPYLINVVNGINNVELQLDKITSYLVNSLRLKKIAIFYPGDEQGQQNFEYTKNLLKKMDVYPIASVSYNPKNLRTSSAIMHLTSKDPEAVICISTHIPMARLASGFLRSNASHTKFVGLDTAYFADEMLKDSGAKIIYASCMPIPGKANYEIVDEYILNVKKYCPGEKVFSFLGLAYYIHASIIEKALLKLDLDKIDKKDLKNALRDSIEDISNLDLGGFIADFNYHSRQAYPLEPRVFKGRALSCTSSVTKIRG